MGFEVVQGSNGTILSFTIREGNVVKDLTNATVQMLLTLRSSGKLKQATITDPINGKCQVALNSEDVLFDGVYTFQLTVTFSDGSQFTSNAQKLTVTKKLGFVPVVGGGTGGSTDIVSGNNGHILVNGVDVKVYDDKTINDQITQINNSDAIKRLAINNSGKLTIDGNEFKNGDNITTSSTNGNILINGQEFKVYDDQSVRSDVSNILNMDIIKRLGISAGGKLTLDGIEQTGSGGGSQDMPLVVKDYFSGSANITKTYIASMVGLEISNDGTSDLSFTVNGLTIPVKAGEVYSANFDPFTSLTINSTVAYRATVSAILNGTVTSDTTPPNNVTGLSTSNVTSSGLTLTWTASSSSDIASYDVYNGSTLLGNTTSTTYSVTSLSATTAYTFTIKAKDSSGNLASGTSVNVTTPAAPDITAPTVSISPNGGTFGSAQTVTLSGNDNSGGTVNIYYTLDGSTPTASSTKYTSAITISSTTTIKYIGVDPSGNTSVVQSALFTIDTVAPNNVTNLTTSNVSATAVTLSWTASNSSDVASYDVYNGSTKLGNVTGTTYNVSGLTASTAYTFTVKAKDAVGNIASGTSVNITTSSTVDTTPPADVTGLTTGTATLNSIPVSWTLSSSNDVANYEVAYSTGGAYTVASNLVNASSTSYTINGLTAGTNYTIRVVAIDTSGNRSTGVTTTKTTAASVNYALSATPSSGTYNATQNVVLSASPNGATIYYTTNGSTPTTSSSVYSSPIVVSANGTETIKFFVQDSVGNVSSVQTATYTIDTVAPIVTISPLAGTYNATQSVTISSNETSTIYYTTDGSTPTTSSSVYSAPISVSATETIKYLVIDTAGNQTTGSATYTIQTNPSPVTNLLVTTASIAPSSIPVTWTAPSGGTSVNHYEVSYMPSGGSWTVASSSVASSATSYTFTGLHQTTNYTLKVVAIDINGNRSTDTTVTATTATLTTSASPSGGTYASAQTVTLSSNGVSGTTIYYTTDGSTPTASSPVYSSPITVSATETIKFYAVNPVGDSSVVQSQAYTINLQAGNALLMNGTSDYISVPSINFDTVEITLDLLNSTTTQELFYGDTQNFATINSIGNNLSQRYVNGTAVSSFTSPSLNTNQKYTLKFSLKTAVTETIFLFAGSGGSSNWLNAIFYGATFYLAGNVVAKYDASTGILTDQSGNGKDATLHGGTWKTNPMYINASVSPAAVIGNTWGIKNVPTYTLTTNITNSTIYYEWSTSSNDANLTTSSSVYSAPLPWPLGTGGTRYLRYFGVNHDTGDQTSITTITVVVDDIAPANVTALTATPAQTSVALSWTASGSSDLASYNVYNGSNFVANVLKGTNTYTVTGLTASTSYSFKVTSVDQTNNESAGVTVTTTTTA